MLQQNQTTCRLEVMLSCVCVRVLVRCTLAAYDNGQMY